MFGCPLSPVLICFRPESTQPSLNFQRGLLSKEMGLGNNFLLKVLDSRYINMEFCTNLRVPLLGAWELLNKSRPQESPRNFLVLPSRLFKCDTMRNPVSCRPHTELFSFSSVSYANLISSNLKETLNLIEPSFWLPADFSLAFYCLLLRLEINLH